MSYFLGLDCSTQSLTATIICSASKQIIYEKSISFDKTLPQYNTVNGVLPSPVPGLAHTPPLMWVTALETIIDIMKSDGIQLDRIKAISGSAQQHGSVYLNESARHSLRNLDPSQTQTLTTNLKNIFSRVTSPIWMDSSTSEQCQEIEEAFGGRSAIIETTGSAAFERFTASQIRKFALTEPKRWEETKHIALVSSFFASLLSGVISPIDYCDGSGMNLMDIRTKIWHPKALSVTALNLPQKLPPLAPPCKIIGKIHPYYVSRYGFSEDTDITVWSGDNPCSVVGLGLVVAGMTAISLGTSDTFFGTMPNVHTDPKGAGHLFCSPTGDYMTIIVYKNGSLARERIRKQFNLDWEGFSKMLNATPPGNNGKLMLPWFEPEIVPRVLSPQVHRLGLAENDAAGNCRAVVEAQLMSMRIHSDWMGSLPTQIFVTGGASVNVDILQVIADVFQCPVYRQKTSNSASLGAALRAAHSYLLQYSDSVNWQELVSDFTEPDLDSRKYPQSNTKEIYDKLCLNYWEFENKVLQNSEYYQTATYGKPLG